MMRGVGMLGHKSRMGRFVRRSVVFTAVAVCGLAGTLGCRGPRQVQLRQDEKDELGKKGDPLSVSLRVLLQTPRGERQLAEGESLRSGDRIALTVRVNQPAYLYVVHFAPDGSASTLFPLPGYEMAPASCPLRIPQKGSLYLQDPTGSEDLRVVASLRPLPLVDRRLCEELRLSSCEPPPTANAQPLPCPDTPAAPKVKTDARAIFPYVKVGRDDGQGAASLRFSFRHIP